MTARGFPTPFDEPDPLTVSTGPLILGDRRHKPDVGLSIGEGVGVVQRPLFDMQPELSVARFDPALMDNDKSALGSPRSISEAYSSSVRVLARLKGL